MIMVWPSGRVYFIEDQSFSDNILFIGLKFWFVNSLWRIGNILMDSKSVLRVCGRKKSLSFNALIVPGNGGLQPLNEDILDLPYFL